MKNGSVFAVLDLDSPLPDHFDAEDESGLVKLIDAIADNLG